jgi:hypothetical protein
VSFGTCLCIGSTNLLLYTHVFAYTLWKTCLTEKFRGKMKSLRFLSSDCLFVTEHKKFMMLGYEQLDEQIFKTKRSHFIGFELFGEILSCSQQ